MTIRADIDPQDLANLQRDIRKRFTRASISLAVTAAGLLAAFAGAAFAAWRAVTAIMQAGAAPLAVNFTQAARTVSPDFVALSVSAAIMMFCIAAAALVYKTRRARHENRKRERIKQGLTIGRFDYQFTESHLVIKGPIALKKTAWSAIDRIENAKSNFIFWKYDGSFEFLPKNTVQQKDLFETLQKNHGAAIKSNLSFDEAVHAKPLSVSFECVTSDLAEYRAHYHRQREGVVSALRTVAHWRPWPAYLFLAFTLIAAASLYIAFRAFDLLAAAAGFGFAFAAAGVFVLNSTFFRGPAHPFRRDGKWPYGQSEMMSVTLSKNGVFISRNGSSEIIEWQGVQDFVERRLTSYLVVMPDYAIPVPKRVFLNAEHYRAFSSFAKARLSEAARARAEHKQQRLMSSLNSKQQAPQQTAPKPNGAAAPGRHAQRPPAKPAPGANPAKQASAQPVTRPPQPKPQAAAGGAKSAAQPQKSQPRPPQSKPQNGAAASAAPTSPANAAPSKPSPAAHPKPRPQAASR